MIYVSTRQASAPVDAAAAIRAGAAPDGGLYMPAALPVLDIEQFDPARPLAQTAADILAPFLAGSPLEGEARAMAADAFNFLLKSVDLGQLSVLELFHGPTGAFKDFGARFLFRCLDRIAGADAPVSVLAATSGDTGGAVGCAAEGRAHARAVILFPKGRISAFQEHQLCCWRAPVRALRVDGDFDACQTLVKQAFADPQLSARHGLTSANSISIGRLLPQVCYWAHAALGHAAQAGQAPGLIIPSGNLGNALAALIARNLGFPVGPVVLATNANATLADWARHGVFEPRASIATLANAMDVGAPSNFERLGALPDRAIHSVASVHDDDIRATIRRWHGETGYIACPHTATGLAAFDRLDADAQKERPWIVAATAHPFKFADAVEPVINAEIAAPDNLAGVLERPVEVTDIRADLTELAAALAH
ncbi:threonine synthase [Maricaulis sp.]|uniref:threonine synthase n=1 Tax=Maricaulis sp. TaxID=1486257 RepID=UPI00261A9152|nr:threonine synthase [Maricaulis sp.]